MRPADLHEVILAALIHGIAYLLGDLIDEPSIPEFVYVFHIFQIAARADRPAGALSADFAF